MKRERAVRQNSAADRTADKSRERLRKALRCARAKSKCFEHAPAPQSRRDGLGTVRCIFAGDKTTAECRTFAAPEAAAIDGEPVLELQHAAVRTAPKGFTQSLAAFVGRAVGRTILPDCTLAHIIAQRRLRSSVNREAARRRPP